eukprot:scaffold295_cov96-Cylindrotheca_fusiformis.AAC.2
MSLRYMRHVLRWDDAINASSSINFIAGSHAIGNNPIRLVCNGFSTLQADHRLLSCYCSAEVGALGVPHVQAGNRLFSKTENHA